MSFDLLLKGGVLPDGTEFADAVELSQVLVDDGSFAECATEKMMIYALGRGVGFSDLSYVRHVAEVFEANDHQLRSLITEVVLSEPFRYRRGRAE